MQVNRMDRKSEKGFSLIELIVVMVILTMLAGLIGLSYSHYIAKSKIQGAKIQIEMLGESLQAYYLEIGHYPDTSAGLQALVQNSGNSDSWNGPYLKKEKVPVDPWGKPYVYRCPGMHGDYDLFSLGPDGVDGGDDDIVSW